MREDFSFKDVSREAKINYDGLKELGYSNLVTTNFEKTDTIPTFNLTWKKGLSANEISAEKERFGKWIKVRLKLDTLKVN